MRRIAVAVLAAIVAAGTGLAAASIWLRATRPTGPVLSNATPPPGIGECQRSSGGSDCGWSVTDSGYTESPPGGVSVDSEAFWFVRRGRVRVQIDPIAVPGVPLPSIVGPRRGGWNGEPVTWVAGRRGKVVTFNVLITSTRGIRTTEAVGGFRIVYRDNLVTHSMTYKDGAIVCYPTAILRDGSTGCSGRTVAPVEAAVLAEQK